MNQIFKQRSSLLVVLLFCSLPAFATWSIILVDPVTKEIGIAGASCTPNVYGIGAIAPGKGAIVVQAMSNGRARAKGLRMILADASPQEVLAEIMDAKYDPEWQQYAIVCIQAADKPVTYTGTSTNPSHGALTAPGISVQGNTLVSEKVVTRIFDTILYAQSQSLSLDYTLMLALEAGAKAGGDKRCGAQTASSAFITVVKPGDSTTKPFLHIIVSGMERGGTNAVEILRKKYNQWKKDN